MVNKSHFILKNQVVIVTGGSKGIGKEITNFLASEGCCVYSISRNHHFKNKTPNLNQIDIDITNYNEIDRLVLKIFKKHKRINTLINCAGVSLSSNTSSMNTIKETFETNFFALYNITKSVFNCMKIHKEGSIINISSINAKMAFSKNPGYVASKGAVSALTRSLALDYGEYGVRVNAICPGYIQSNMTKKSYNSNSLSKKRISRNIVKRWGLPKDIIGTIALLSSPQSSYITGTEIFIDGGFSINGI